jgi:regulator of sigma E protease
MLTLFERGGTKYTLNWIPLGGFMRPAGEDDPVIDGGFASSPKRARISVLAAGPGANVLVAFLLLTVMFMLGAPAELPGARIIAVEPGSPAAESGLQESDIIIKADDVEITNYGVLTNYIHQSVIDHPGTAIILTVQRDGQTIEASVAPRIDPPEGQGPTGIQVQPIVEIRHYGLFQAISHSGAELWNFTKAFVELPVAAIRNQIPARLLRPVSVVGISQLGGQALDSSITQNAAWPILQLTALISLALAVTNLLPLPALDGGRILFVFIEALRGQRIDPQRETMVHLIGFAILLTTMLVFVYLDIVDPLVIP